MSASRRGKAFFDQVILFCGEPATLLLYEGPLDAAPLHNHC